MCNVGDFMKKFIFILMIIVSNFFSQLNAEIINDIVINNNDRISLGTIKTYGNIELGKSYSEDDLNNILKNLYETNFFKDVSLKIKKNTLIINVVENKLIQTININGIKSTNIKKAILERLSLRTKSPFIESHVENDIMNIKSSLNNEGCYFSKVTSNIEDNINNTINLNFNIDLGDKVRISKIEFTGDKIVKDRTLRNLITVEESKFWKFLSKKKYLNPKNLSRDERLLKNYYLDEGYYDVVINTTTAKLLDNNSFDITFNIKAGNLYEINDTKLILPIDYDIKNFKDVEQLLDELKSEKLKNGDIEPFLIVLDSVGQMSSNKEKTDLISGNLKVDMTRAKSLAALFRSINTDLGYLNIPMVVCNHVYLEQGSMYPRQIIKGGKALVYSSSVIGMMSKAKLKSGDEDDMDLGSSGIVVTFKTAKNRLAKPKKIKFEISFVSGMNVYTGLDAFCRPEFYDQIGIAKGKEVVDKETGEITFQPGGNRWYIRHLGKSVYTKNLLTSEVFTPEVLKLMEPIVNDYFRYKTIDEIEDMAKEFDNSVKEDDTNGFEDMDSVDASDLFD